MIRVRFTAPATTHLNFQPGDEIHVAALTPELERLVTAQRLDGKHVAQIVRDGTRGRRDETPERPTAEEFARAS